MLPVLTSHHLNLMMSDSDRPQLILLRPTREVVMEPLSARFQLLKPWESPLPRDRFFAAHAARARALLVTGLARVDAPLLDALPALRFVITNSVGVDHIDLAECARRGVAVANAGSVYTTDVADYAVGLLVDVLRHVTASNRYVRLGLWPSRGDYPLGFKLRGKRVGIVGLGSIGSEVAKRLEAFSCFISYFSRKRKPSVTYTYFPSVCDLAVASDVLVVTCALTDETYHIIDSDVMSALGKEDGIIINVGRGPLIDEVELVKRLKYGEIAGAGLDVFEYEPIVPKEFFYMDNVVLSHHVAVLTHEAASDLVQLIMANLEAFFSDKPLLSPVSICSL
ncbi:glyoxylate/hydroxypyruvate reductase HPR3-like [Canna indica]|uniref:Glyoxylate/hydroxypyruvate reductase HPR3-like n=1 Tax=Canna indica TaxID=4628 RepID=A0AAQ3K8V2_9LILI|nr:glyoxylate/hydroxypyruvate reductase HPR3-like [Canna indica]